MNSRNEIKSILYNVSEYANIISDTVRQDSLERKSEINYSLSDLLILL